MVDTARNVNLFVSIHPKAPTNPKAAMIVQIYEIQTPREAQTMIDLGVDHVGSVLISEDRWQNETLKSVVDLVRRAGRKSSLIPLFGTVDTICRAVDHYRPHILHFCETLPGPEAGGHELETILRRQEEIGRKYPQLELMRSIPIGRRGEGDIVDSLAIARWFEPVSHWFLTDTLLAHEGPPANEDQPVAGFVGITGETCDWEIARQLVEQSAIPVILAGGIGPRNAARGIEQVRPAGLDSCTRTNAVDHRGRARRFRKDPRLVKELIRVARNGACAPPSRTDQRTKNR